MTRWKKDETNFSVSVSSNGHTKSCRIPKPILEKLDNPDKITFTVQGKKILMTAR